MTLRNHIEGLGHGGEEGLTKTYKIGWLDKTKLIELRLSEVTHRNFLVSHCKLSLNSASCLFGWSQ